MRTEKVTLSTNEKMQLVSNLATMLSAGIPILETVDSLLDGSKGAQKKLLEAMREDLVQGKHLYETFSRFPKSFDKVTVNLLKASEEAGTLETTLKDMKDTIRREAEFSDKIKSAMFYPFIILAVFVGVLLLMLLFVIPRISTVFLRMKVPLPLPTKVLILVSQAMLQNTIPTLAVIIGGSIGLFFLYRTQKRFVLNILFSLPVISTLVKNIDLTRFSRSLYLLLNSGIPITQALELGEEVVSRKDLTRVIRHSKEMVSSGKKLSEGLTTARGVFPPIMIKIIEAGEKTGSLDKSMQDISEYLDYQVSNSLKAVTTLMEPLMLVFVGVLVGGMMMAIIAPIYGLITQVSPR